MPNSYFSRSVLIGTPVDLKRFYLEKGSVPSIYAKPENSLDIDYPRNEGKDISLRTLLKRSTVA